MYSWINEVLGDGCVDDERCSELIADTVGGRTRAQIEEYRRQRDLQQTQQDQRPQNQQNQTDHQQQNQQAQNVNTSGRSSRSSNGDSVFTRRIQQHPQPGDGAERLFNLVQQPFSVKFGQPEVERAGSSTRPPLTPFFKDAHPICHNSPRSKPTSRPDSPRPMPFAQSTGTQTDGQVGHGGQVVQSAVSVTNGLIPPVIKTTTAHRRAHSLSDYPPLYDFSQRPAHNRHSSLTGSSGADPNFYRRRFINSLLNEIRKSKELERKLDGRWDELNEACRRDANELSAIRRERELLVRELEIQSREYEFEERERRRHDSTARRSPSPAPRQPILKHSSSFPPCVSNSKNNRVNFASPVCTSIRSTSRPTRTSPIPGSPANANKQREQGQKCRAHEIEFHDQQQRTKSRNPPANPSSVFQYVRHRQ